MSRDPFCFKGLDRRRFLRLLAGAGVSLAATPLIRRSWLSLEPEDAPGGTTAAVHEGVGPAWFLLAGDQADPRHDRWTPDEIRAAPHYLNVYASQTRRVHRISVPAPVHSILQWREQRLTDSRGEVAAGVHWIGIPLRKPWGFLLRGSIESPELREMVALPGHEFYGHGEVDGPRGVFYASEQPEGAKEGVISVRDARSGKVLERLSSHGHGPHELRVTGGGRYLAVCNGDEKYHVEESSLAVIDIDSGRLLQKWKSPDRTLQFRHLEVRRSASGEDEFWIATQRSILRESKGEGLVPLPVVIDSRNGIQILQVPNWVRRKGLRHQLLSLVFNSDQSLAAMSCPAARSVLIWDANGKVFDSIHRVPAASGVRFVAGLGAFAVSSGSEEAGVRLIPAGEGHPEILAAHRDALSQARGLTGSHLYLF